MNLMRPQLAENLNPNDLETKLTDNNWFAEPKLDGHRILVIVTNGIPRALNRNGEPFRQSFNQRSFAEFSGDLFGPGTWAFDTEYMADDETFYVFDLLATPKADLTEQSFEQRRNTLEHLFTVWAPFHIKPVPCVKTEHGKRNLLEKVETAGAEGVMFKHRDSIYYQGRRSHLMLKHKLWKSIDCVITELYREGKRSVGLHIYTMEGVPVDIGSCTMSDRNLTRVQVGDVIEVKYLYVLRSEGGRLFQPSFLRIRRDKSPQECTIDQIQYTDRSPVLG